MSDPGTQEQPDDGLVDLLIKQVTEGLSPAEQRALDALDSVATSEQLRHLERAAAAISLAGTGSPAPLPPTLRARLEESARHFGGRAAGGDPARVVPLQPRSAAARSGLVGWFAAAACLLLAVFAWVRTPETHLAVAPPPAPISVPAPAPEPPLPPTLAQQREALMSASGALKFALGATKDPGSVGVSGDAVWDPVTQRGFLHFVGLAANDPQVRQYQIWIFDGTRDQRYPVDGGVFDVPADSNEVIIPIRAALAVRKLAAFAVTIEKPGGVVVSARGHVVALGAAG